MKNKPDAKGIIVRAFLDDHDKENLLYILHIESVDTITPQGLAMLAFIPFDAEGGKITIKATINVPIQERFILPFGYSEPAQLIGKACWLWCAKSRGDYESIALEMSNGDGEMGPCTPYLKTV